MTTTELRDVYRKARTRMSGLALMPIQSEIGRWRLANLPADLEPAQDELETIEGCGKFMAAEILAAIGILMCSIEEKR